MSKGTSRAILIGWYILGLVFTVVVAAQMWFGTIGIEALYVGTAFFLITVAVECISSLVRLFTDDQK